MDAAASSAAPSVLIDFEGVAQLLGRDPSPSLRLWLWRGAKSGSMPAPIQLSPGRIAWYRAEWAAHLASRPRVKYAVTAEVRDAA